MHLVYTTIREPHYTVDLPLAVARLLAIPREKIYKTVLFPLLIFSRWQYEVCCRDNSHGTTTSKRHNMPLKTVLLQDLCT